MHHGIHVDDRHGLIVPHHGREREKEAVLRFDLRDGSLVERFALVDTLQIDHCVAKLVRRSHLERLQDAPALSIRYTSAIERVG